MIVRLLRVGSVAVVVVCPKFDFGGIVAVLFLVGWLDLMVVVLVVLSSVCRFGYCLFWWSLLVWLGLSCLVSDFTLPVLLPLRLWCLLWFGDCYDLTWLIVLF